VSQAKSAAPTLIQDLYAHNDWANGKLFELADALDDAQLDAPLEMGFGSLRATLHHMLAAERLWLDRWQGKPWAPLPTDAHQVTLHDLAAGFQAVASERDKLIAAETDDGYRRVVSYQNTQRQGFQHRLRELLIHVANHAVHHRSQALHFLKRCRRTIPGGLDYLFYRIAHPTVPSDPESVDRVRKRGLEAGSSVIEPPVFDTEILGRLCQYGNWAMDTVLSLARTQSTAQLEQTFDIGVGGLRRTLFHLCEAEQWWYANWTQGPSAFQQLPADLPFGEFIDVWRSTAQRRDDWFRQQSPQTLAEQVTATPGGTPVQFRLGESVLQLCCHGTHHRAQAINMLRRLGTDPPAIDYVVWLRGPGALSA
jgi:uncharacterized damage-inducible protein DinB